MPVGNRGSVCPEHRMQERMVKDEAGEVSKGQIEEALIPCSGIKVPMVLNSKDISLNLYFRISVW